MDSAGRETESEPCPQAYYFLSRTGTVAYGLAFGIEALEQTHSLKEVKPIALLIEALRYR
jgi:hypothetical protein